MSSKLTSFLIGLAVLVIVAVGIYAWHPWQKTSNMASQQEQSISNTAIEQSSASIVTKGDFAGCAQLAGKVVTGLNYQTVCQNTIALNMATKNLDISWCLKLDNKLVLISDCQNQVLTQKALADKNVSDCNAAPSPDLASACQNTYAAKNPSLGDCLKYTDSAQKAACQNYYWQIQLFNNPTSFVCTNFSSPSLVSDCKNFKILIAASKTTPSDCMVLKSIFMQNVCITKSRS